MNHIGGCYKTINYVEVKVTGTGWINKAYNYVEVKVACTGESIKNVSSEVKGEGDTGESIKTFGHTGVGSRTKVAQPVCNIQAMARAVM